MVQEITIENAISNQLHSIEEDRLTILCGAGLSMAPPSNIPSAANLAQHVFDKCQAAGEVVTNDLEEQARYYLANGRFSTYFIKHLIPRDSFASPHNDGHSTIADFLLCRAISAAISTNVDVLIERAGQELSGEVEGYLDGQEAETGSIDRSPLLKIHGCWTKSKNETIWAAEQLEQEPIMTRIEHSRNWLQLHLGNKDLLVVGFWSDWSYLNTVLEGALGAVHPARVTIVDPCDTEVLNAKAPGLSAIGEQDGVEFTHVKASGSEFLDRLRKRFSIHFFRKALHSSKQAYIDATGSEPDENWFELPENISTSNVYAVRRDIEGREPSEFARRKSPDPQESLVGLTIMQLLAKGAIFNDGFWLMDGKKIRVLRTRKLLHSVKDAFKRELPPFGSADIVICVGSEDIGLPSNIARSDGSVDIVRGGPPGEWLTRAKACEELVL